MQMMMQAYLVWKRSDFLEEKSEGPKDPDTNDVDYSNGNRDSAHPRNLRGGIVRIGAAEVCVGIVGRA